MEVRQWYPQLYRSALRRTGDPEAASEVAQQTWCQALAGWRQFAGRCRPTTWLHGILVNCLRDWARGRSRRRTEPIDEWSLPPGGDGQLAPADALIGREHLAHLRQLIGALPAKLRAAFVAAVLDGYSYEQSGEILGVPAGTIASRVHEARKALTRQMRNKFPEEWQ